MTNHWIDIRNADVILVMGSNPASNHPISMKWIMKAKERGAKLIVVDPRFTQTASKADVYAPMRSGTDIAFLGGMIKYILDNNLEFKEYVLKYTNAPFLVNADFKGPGDLNGLFSGYDEKTRKYDKKTWSFQMDENGLPKKDLSLKDPNCVYQLLKKHYSRYTLDKVSSITGTPKDKLAEVYKTLRFHGQAKPRGHRIVRHGVDPAYGRHPEHPGHDDHPAPSRQHGHGRRRHQRAPRRIERPGVDGPRASVPHPARLSADSYGIAHSPAGLHREVYSQDQGTQERELVVEPRQVYHQLPQGHLRHQGARRTMISAMAGCPKLDEGMNASWLMLFDKMLKGQFEGFFAWGQNPACSGANSNKTRQALAKLKWMVNVNLFDNETGSFWKGPGMNPKDIQTEVFLLPAASSVEKEGSLSNSGRWAQWRYKAIDPIGQSKPDSEIMNELYFRVKSLYQKQGGKFPEPIVNLTWNYGEKDANGKIKEVNTHNVAKEINGYYLEDVYDKTQTPPKLLGKKGELCASFVHLQADGTTSSGCWIYSQSYTQKEGKIINMMARRGKNDPTGLGMYPEWSWAWPVNRRIIYNRAAVDPQGKPWDAKRSVIKWDPIKPDAASKKPGTWVGDVPDGPAPPMATEKGKLPFIMMATGVGGIFGPGMADGPFPEHYEALECPLEENSMSKQRINPTIKMFSEKEDAFYSCDTRFPFVATTYRVSEHWQTGVMTRHAPWQLEMQPQMFVELSKELAKEKGISDGEKVIVKSGRGELWAIAIVTDRFKPFKVAGSTVHQVGIPWHFGWQFPEDGSGGDSANLLTPTIGDANTMIPESKAFMVNVVKA